MEKIFSATWNHLWIAQRMYTEKSFVKINGNILDSINNCVCISAGGNTNDSIYWIFLQYSIKIFYQFQNFVWFITFSYIVSNIIYYWNVMRVATICESCYISSKNNSYWIRQRYLSNKCILLLFQEYFLLNCSNIPVVLKYLYISFINSCHN